MGCIDCQSALGATHGDTPPKALNQPGLRDVSVGVKGKIHMSEVASCSAVRLIDNKHHTHQRRETHPSFSVLEDLLPQQRKYSHNSTALAPSQSEPFL